MLSVPESFSDNYRVDIHEFYTPLVTSSNTGYHLWEKPKWANVISILLIGAGGRGANGTSGALGTTRVGGGGGGGGAITRCFGLAAFFPDKLYITIGRGGAAGVNPIGSFIATQPVNYATSVLGSLFLSAGAGGNAFGSTAGSGGTGGSNFGQITSSFINWNTVAGPAGSNGVNTTTAPTALTLFSTNIVNGGCGGGGATNTNADGPGGGYSSSWVSASAAGVNPGGSGSNGVILLPPDYVFSTIGGTGGAGNGTGTGGNGGNGAIGSGGGGGGAGVTGGTAGGGGNGYCLIIAY